MLSAEIQGSNDSCPAKPERMPVSVRVMPDGRLLLTGRGGYVGVGTAQSLETLEVDVSMQSAKKGRAATLRPSFATSVMWRDRVLISGGRGIFELTGNEVQRFSDCPALTLASDGSLLWAVTHDSLARYDGEVWAEIES